MLLKFDLLCHDHVYCDEWHQALNLWSFILKSWIILMKISTVFSLMHVITPLPSTQSKLKSFSDSNSSSISNFTINSLVIFFQRSSGRGARVSWPRWTCRMATDCSLVLSTEEVPVMRKRCKKVNT